MATSTLLTERIDGLNGFVNIPAANSTLFWRNGSGVLGTLPISTFAQASDLSFFAQKEGDNIYTGENSFNSSTTINGDLTIRGMVNFDEVPSFVYSTGVAALHRTALGLGSLATQSGTFSGSHSGSSSGVNTGDQTSIVGITGSISQFNAALTGGDFATLAGSEALTNKTVNGFNFIIGPGAVAGANGVLAYDTTSNRIKYWNGEASKQLADDSSADGISNKTFSGTFDGILGGNTPAAASVTTLTASGTISGSNFSGSSSGANTGDQDLSGYGLLDEANIWSEAQDFPGGINVTGGVMDSLDATTANLSVSVSTTYGISAVFSYLGTSASNHRTALGLGTLATQSGTFSGTSSGTNTGDQTTITGNAGTAAALQTTRTIGGSNFDGTANVTSFPSPGAIGGTTPNTIASTGVTTPTVASNSTLTLSTSGTNNIILSPGATSGMVQVGPASLGLQGFTTTGGFMISTGSAAALSVENTVTSGPTGGAALGLFSNDAAPLSNGDRLGLVTFGGSQAATLLRAPTVISSFATENWVLATAVGSELRFDTTPNGSVTRATRLTIQNGGVADFAVAATSATYLKTGITTVGGLPAASTVPWARWAVSNATMTHTLGIGTVVVAGGANSVPVYSDGTAWRIG